MLMVGLDYWGEIVRLSQTVQRRDPPTPARFDESYASNARGTFCPLLQGTGLDISAFGQ